MRNEIRIAAAFVAEMLVDIDDILSGATSGRKPAEPAHGSCCKFSAIHHGLVLVSENSFCLIGQYIRLGLTAATLGLWGLCLNPGFGQEPQVDASQMPRIAPTEPERALETFEIREGFRLKLAAHEPDVVDPIAMAFDADGGLYVIEMRGYSERREDRLGRIRYLEDRDNDGIFESSTVFKDGLKWPTGIVCYKGGVFVGVTPDLIYLKDEDGDRVADVERVVFSGFGPEDSRLNMQALFNSFHWGPDNRIWGAAAASGGRVMRPGSAEPPIVLRRADFSFDPEKLDFRLENGTAQYGMSFDSLGRRFVCSNSRHVVWVAYERGDVAPNPFFDLPAALTDIADDGAAAPVYRVSPDEPWRVVRTRWRVSGVVRGMIEGGGRVSGYFTSATGIHMYWGDAYGKDFRDNVFVGDVGSNLVHRKVLHANGNSIQPIATRPDDEQTIEFLRSRDNWFRPASFATGPDGCLYICDMYRETIEHPWSLPPGIKQHLDLNSGNDRGRIYRVEKEGFRRPSIPRLSEASDDELRSYARSSGNDWTQTTARRLLYERGQALEAKPRPEPFPSLLANSEPMIDKISEWGGDPWGEAIILNSLRSENDIGKAWSASLSTASSPDFQLKLAEIMGRTGRPALIDAVAKRYERSPFDSRLAEKLEALRRGVGSSDADWIVHAGRSSLKGLFVRAETQLASASENLDTKLAALRVLDLQPNGGSEAVLKSIVLDADANEALVNEALERISDTAFLAGLLDRLAGEQARRVVERLARTKQGGAELLVAIGNDETLVEFISPAAWQQLRQNLTDRVEELLPALESRADALNRYQASLQIEGDAVKGVEVFDRLCISCHKTADGRGVSFGPPITSFASSGKEFILSNLIDPNREVAPQYQAFQFAFKNGDVQVGMIASEDTRNVSLALPTGETISFPRTDVIGMTGLKRSLMPEGLEQAVSVEEMADLLTYLAR
jgi:putative membrane-bound dehydrogenase-like protein